jgi:protein ImuB
LVALVGSDRVGTPVLEETHRADAFHIEPFSWEVGAIDLNRLAPTAPLRAALRRFRPNIAASVLLARERPIHLRSLHVSGAVSGERGPYRASGNWWDEKNWSRSEWDLELGGGDLVRVYESEGTWKIEGAYD